MSGEVTRREMLAGGLSVAALAALAGCGKGASHKLVQQAAATCARGSDLGAIEHIVVVMQENRSFDHYFGSYPGVRGFDDHAAGHPGVFAQPWPGGGSGRTLLPFHLDAATRHPQCIGNADVPIHDWLPQHLSWNGGKMDGFVTAHSEPRFDGAKNGPLVMGYYDRADVAFYYALADAFTICDAYHASVIGPTMPNRLYSLSATIDPQGTHGGPVVETPGFATSPAAIGSARWPTMFEALEDHAVSWKVYQPPNTAVGPNLKENLSIGFNALLYFAQYQRPASTLYQKAFLPSWPDEFTKDVRSGQLPSVSWLIPPLVASEHPSSPPDNGEWFVSQVLATLVANPEVWAKTVMLLVYDENGGFFDHVAPPVAPPGTPGEELAAGHLPADAGDVARPIGLGFRVPAIVVSPFSRGGYVNSDLFDHTSILRLIETRFGVPVPNLSAWRRKTVGDLSATLDLRHPNTSLPKLPPTAEPDPAVEAQCPNAEQAGSLLAPPPALALAANQRMPTQEPGRPRRRTC